MQIGHVGTLAVNALGGCRQVRRPDSPAKRIGPARVARGLKTPCENGYLVAARRVAAARAICWRARWPVV